MLTDFWWLPFPAILPLASDQLCPMDHERKRCVSAADWSNEKSLNSPLASLILLRLPGNHVLTWQGHGATESLSPYMEKSCPEERGRLNKQKNVDCSFIHCFAGLKCDCSIIWATLFNRHVLSFQSLTPHSITHTAKAVDKTTPMVWSLLRFLLPLKICWFPSIFQVRSSSLLWILWAPISLQ